MSIRKYLINPLLLALMLLAGHFFACQPEDWSLEVNCLDCYDFEPDSANLIVYLTIDEENDSIPLTFYKGSVEDGVIDWQDTASSEEFFLFSEIGTAYSVEAIYQSGSRTIIAYDGDEMSLYDAAEDCGSPCYIVKGGIFDLRLIPE